MALPLLAGLSAILTSAGIGVGAAAAPLALSGAAPIAGAGQMLSVQGIVDAMGQTTKLNMDKLAKGKQKEKLAIAFGNDPTGAALGGFPGMAEMGKGLQMPQRRYSTRF